MLKSFPLGGVHPAECKLSAGAAIEPLPLPKVVSIPLAQHIGAPAEPTVVRGDRVRVGQLIGRRTGFVSADVHSSVSGKVTAVGPIVEGNGLSRPAVTIAVEGDEWMPDIDRSEYPVNREETETFTPEQIVERIASAGIVGLGGAAFPTHVKLSLPQNKLPECLIVNGVECEPYLTADHRLMLERTDEVLAGIRLLARALGVSHAFLGIENNKPDAIALLSERAAAWPGIRVVPLRVRYPQGGEKQLVAAVTGRRIPSGALPIDAGCAVQNVGTALAVYEAVVRRKPLFERVVTVTGRSLARPSNLSVRIGTPVSALIEYCGGLPADAGKVIAGGPMMGRAVYRLDAPVTKGMSGILVMPESESLRRPARECIRCTRCVQACPMGLEPYLLARLSARSRFEELERGRVTDCIECGCCQYGCPAWVPLLDRIRVGKAAVMRLVRSRRS